MSVPPNAANSTDAVAVAPGESTATDRPLLVVTSEGELLGEDTPVNRDLSRRVRACVNACAGIPTEDLENGIVGDMCRVLNDVVPLLERQAGRRSA